MEQRSNMGTETVFSPPNQNTSMISDDEDPMNPTPIIGNPEQYTPQIPQRRHHPIELCQHVQPISDMPESPPPEDQGPGDISVHTIFPMHRHQLRSTTPSKSRQ